jgi:hypothetical protein
MIGQQEIAFGKRIDLLAMDAEGRLAIIELKRDKTPREVVAQLLEYGAWADSLALDDVEEIFARLKGNGGVDLSKAFSERFGTPLPDTFSAREHQLIVVCSELDSSTEHIVEYLSARGIPINAVFFRTFKDAAGELLARTWFIERQEAEVRASRAGRQGETWNGVDYYVAFGHGSSRDWEDARKYGFVSAGGGSWYSRTLSMLQPGARIFACVPGIGYVGVGKVTEPARRVAEFEVEVDGQKVPILSLPMRAPEMGSRADDAEKSEYLVRVDWIETLPLSAAIWEKGMFANQNSACKLRNKFTLDVLYDRFGIEKESNA